MFKMAEIKVTTVFA